jgi:hypothetical protein
VTGSDHRSVMVSCELVQAAVVTMGQRRLTYRCCSSLGGAGRRCRTCSNRHRAPWCRRWSFQRGGSADRGARRSLASSWHVVTAHWWLPRRAARHRCSQPAPVTLSVHFRHGGPHRGAWKPIAVSLIPRGPRGSLSFATVNRSFATVNRLRWWRTDYPSDLTMRKAGFTTMVV